MVNFSECISDMRQIRETFLDSYVYTVRFMVCIVTFFFFSGAIINKGRYLTTSKNNFSKGHTCCGSYINKGRVTDSSILHKIRCLEDPIFFPKWQLHDHTFIWRCRKSGPFWDGESTRPFLSPLQRRLSTISAHELFVL